MFIKRKLIPFILCVLMLIPLIGCGSAENTVVESASAPVAVGPKPFNPVFDTEPPVSESSVQTESSQEEITEEEIIRFPKDIDDFISNDFDREQLSFTNTISESDWGSASGYTSLEPCRNGICLNNFASDIEMKGLYVSDSFIPAYHWVNGKVLVFAEDNSIRQINMSGEIKTIYTSPDNNRIWSFYILEDYIYVVEGDYLYVVNYNTNDRRLICWVGDVTYVTPSAKSTKTVYIRRFYYEGEYLFTTATYNMLSESGELLESLYPGVRSTDFDREYFEVDISTGAIKQVDGSTVSYGIS